MMCLGPMSTNTLAPADRQDAMQSRKSKGVTSCPASSCGRCSTSPGCRVPWVIVEMTGMSGLFQWHRSSLCSNSVTTGESTGLWKPTGMGSAKLSIDSAAKRSVTSATKALEPETTSCSSELTIAMDNGPRQDSSATTALTLCMSWRLRGNATAIAPRMA